jgi:hypothetical protein
MALHEQKSKLRKQLLSSLQTYFALFINDYRKTQVYANFYQLTMLRSDKRLDTSQLDLIPLITMILVDFRSNRSYTSIRKRNFLQFLRYKPDKIANKFAYYNQVYQGCEIFLGINLKMFSIILRI